MHYVVSGQLLFGATVRFVVILAPGARRLRALARAISALAPEAPVRFGDAQTLKPELLFAHLRPLADVLATGRTPLA